MLKDSSVVNGVVTEADLKGNVTMIIEDGVFRVIRATQIAAMERDINSKQIKAEYRAERKAYVKNATRYQDSSGRITQVLINFDHLQFGIGASMGYRFNPWLQLRGGFRCELTANSVGLLPTRHIGRRQHQAGMYFPLFLQLGGHLPKMRISPYYDFEVGYAFRAVEFYDHPAWHPVGVGGYHLATMLGARFFTRVRYNIAVGVRFAFRGMEMSFREFGHNYEKGILTLEQNERPVSAFFIGLGIIQTFGR